MGLKRNPIWKGQGWRVQHPPLVEDFPEMQAEIEAVHAMVDVERVERGLRPFDWRTRRVMETQGGGEA